MAAETVAAGPPPLPPPTTAENDDPNRYCQLCNVSVTSAPQMKHHLEGSKHAKKLKASGGQPPNTFDVNDTILQSLNAPPPPKLHVGKANVAAVAPIKRDNSIYRTPSGNFYCKPCNITLATETLFNQHFDSKKHIKCTHQSTRD